MDSKHISPLMKADGKMHIKKRSTIRLQMGKQEEKVSSIIMMAKHTLIALP